MAAVYYLKDNRDKIEKLKAELPDNIYIPFNAGRYIERNKNIKGRFYTERPNDSVDLKEWVQYQLDNSGFTFETGDIVTSVSFTVDGTTYPAGTSLETILTAIINAAVTGIAQPHFTFTQSTPASTWNIAHTLTTFPSVTLVNSSEQVIEADITYVDNSNITVTFTTPVSGKAYLN